MNIRTTNVEQRTKSDNRKLTTNKELGALATSWQIKDCFTAFAMTNKKQQMLTFSPEESGQSTNNRQPTTDNNKIN